ncbi:DUF6602 domain-containing protein [Shewanella vaxholmensis]|uniref:DUF6602 domain-containing protein n=1 Tax=Shewanella vaxholmensis TaxID=3063535 RepID=UPI00319B7D78
MTDLLQLLALEMQEIDFRFKKSSIEGKGTPQEVSDRRESVVKKLLEKYFPFPFRIAKGNVIDSFGMRSASIDCLVLNPDHPYTVSDDDRFSVILADGVDYAIEVKPDLTSKSEIERSLHQIHTVKELTRVRHGMLGRAAAPYVKKIPCIVFSNTAYANLELLTQTIVEYYEGKGIKRQNQFDLIVINNRAILVNMRKNSYFFPANNSLGEGIYILQSGSNTLAALLLYLNSLPLSAPRMSSSVLSHYIKSDDSLGYLQCYAHLNERLNQLEIASN